MSCYSDEEMESIGDESDDSDSEYEVIKLNPNNIYESDDSPDEEMYEISPLKNCNSMLTVKENDVEHIVDQEVEMETKITLEKTEEVSFDSFATAIDDDNSLNSNESLENSPKKVRKKLNFQEYKMRRANELPQKPLFDLPKKIAAYELCDVPATLPLLVLPNDPNWMLHKLDCVKREPTNHSKATLAYNPEHYEEIVLVSIGCNTEVTIPPIEDENDSSEAIPANQFLTNIVNNLNKGNVGTLLNSSTTLFSSIQAVVQGKCAATETDFEQTCNSEQSAKDSNTSDHGEDKTIMHLRKDRLRPFKCSVALQTDNISLFPSLLLSPSLIFNRIRNARSYRKKISRSRSRSFSPSEAEYSRVKYHNNNRYSRSQHSTHSSSMNSSGSSSSESDDDSSGSSSSESSDSLKRFNDRQNFRFYNRNQSQGYNYQEERKIVYIGGLEEETTKDEIRRKFLEYGTIKKISFHAKEDGLRYGFVTFAEASCAYEVIDKFAKDPMISKYDIRFGGRRKFCKQTYADLDSIQDTENQKSSKDLSFEELLKMAKKKITSKK